ncbi:MAG: hypothetical protein QME79_13220 [Bacillota bacterium]|nr:hypothetical protein [Bacillota bacterium]
MHRMFQRQGLRPGIFWELPRGEQLFLLASTELAIEEERRPREERRKEGSI